MKKVLGWVISIITISTLFLNLQNVQAAEAAHQFSLIGYDCGSFNLDEGTCTGPNGDYETPVITPNSEIEEGQMIKLAVYLKPGENVTALNTRISFNSNVVEPYTLYVDEDTGEDVFYIQSDGTDKAGTGMWPAKSNLGTGKNTTNWSTSASNMNSQVRLVIMDSANPAKPLTTEGEMVYIYFKVKEGVSANSTAAFTFDPDHTAMGGAAGDISYTNLSYTVGGGENTPVSLTLKSLSVTGNGASYSLDPVFVPDNLTPNKYSTVVPNSVTSVNISAVATATSGITITGTGNQSLSNVGVNSKPIILTDTSTGNTQTYTLEVYRLNNNANLDSLTAGGITLSPSPFSADTTSYTSTVPYATSSTTISATVENNSNAKITSGTGAWSLTNTGTTTNTKTVRVEAENCDSKYTSVPGNSCSYKEYNIEITRNAASSDNTLSYLTVDGVDVPGWSPSNSGPYILDPVSNSKTSVDVNALVNDTGKATISTEAKYKIGTRNLSIGDNTIEIKVIAEDSTPKIYTIKVRRKSNDNTLKTLNLMSTPQGNITPSFSPSNGGPYTFTVAENVTVVTLNAEVNDSSATISESSAQTYTNTFDLTSVTGTTITVVPEDSDSDSKTYTINFVKAKSTNANLSHLEVEGVTLTPSPSPTDPSGTVYTANVSSSVNKVNIIAETEDVNATIDQASDVGEQTLSDTTNTFTVTVTAEDGTTKKVHTIKIIKDQSQSSVALLSSLAVDGMSVSNFNENNQGPYELSDVAFSKEYVIITATAKDGGTVVIDKENPSGSGKASLDPGTNTLKVTAVSADGITQTPYFIKINRGRDTNALLEYIKIDNVLVDGFTKTSNGDYSVTVENDITNLSDLKLTYDTQSKYAIAVLNASQIPNPFSTTNVNTITITVTADSGDMAIYNLYITRKKSSNAFLKNIIPSVSSLKETFVKETLDYTMDVERSVTSVVLTPIGFDNQIIEGPYCPNSLEIGNNNVCTIVVTAEDGVTTNSYSVRINRKKSSNAFLKEIKIDNVLINGFNKETKTYNISADGLGESIKLSATTDEEHATILEGNSRTALLSSGSNSFEFNVTAEDGISTEKYTINITKPQSSNTDLKSLTTTQGTPTSNDASNTPFNPSNLQPPYILKVPYNVTNIDITAIAKEASSKVTIDGAISTNNNTWNKLLTTGDNGPYNILVTAEDGTSRSYPLTIVREKNNNANLSSLTITDSKGNNISFEDGEEFDSADTNYSIRVSNDVKRIKIEGTTEDLNAIKDNNFRTHDISTGTSTIELVVTAEDGITTKTYYIHIYRELSSDATLKELIPLGGVGSLNETFIPSDINHISYTMSVNNEVTNINFTATPTDLGAKVVSITGNDNLELGENTVTISITAEDGTYGSYTIKVTREEAADNYLANLSVVDINNHEYIEQPFVNTKTEYNIEVENDIEYVIISGNPVNTSLPTPAEAGRHELTAGETKTIRYTVLADVPRIYTINITRKSDSNAFLSSLKVEDHEIKPQPFNKGTKTYTLEVESTVTTITIKAEPESATSEVVGGKEQEKTLDAGNNSFVIEVVAQNGAKEQYFLSVYKKSSNNSYLSNLTVNGDPIQNFDTVDAFVKTNKKYEIEVTNSITSVTLDGDPEDSNANDNGPISCPLTSDVTTCTLTVTAQDNTTSDYNVIVKRKRSDNKRLSDLQIDDVSINGFNPAQLDGYSINVDNSVESIKVFGVKEDAKSTVIGNKNYNLKVGANSIPIVVVAEDGTSQTYEIVVNRAANGNVYLKELSVLEGPISPIFDGRVEDHYTLTVPYEVNKLNITATPEEETSKVEISGFDNLVVGSNSVTIKVIAENGNDKTYYLDVTKQPDASNYLDNLRVKDISGAEYPLSPVFNREWTVYEVELPDTIDKVNVEVEKYDAAHDVSGAGEVPITGLPQIHEVKVIPANGIVRTYNILFKKGLSKNTNLLNLSVSPGSLEPTFDPESNQSYDVNLVESADKINITATYDENTQTVTGDGEHNLNPGKNKFDVIVTSEGGTMKLYTIFVYVPEEADDNILNSLTVDKGTLEPIFSSTTNVYRDYLIPEESEITIDATSKYKVEGDIGVQPLQVNQAHTFIVKSVKDGKENPYRVVVINGQIESTKLADLSIKNQTLNETFGSDDLEYTTNIESTLQSIEVIPVPLDKDATVKVNGVELNSDGSSIVGVTPGVNTITITVEKEGLEPTTYTITAGSILDKITSQIHTIDDSYVRTVKPQTTITAFKDELDNPNEYLKIYDADDNEVTDETGIVKTGYKVKLIINDKEYDSKLIVIKGDINGNGRVDQGDYVKLGEHLVSPTPMLVGAYLEAGKINPNDRIDQGDYVKLGEHLVGPLNIFEEE